MELTKEQYRKRKNCILKFKHWFGSDVFEEVFKDYDYYINQEDALVYVYRRIKIKWTNTKNKQTSF